MQIRRARARVFLILAFGITLAAAIPSRAAGGGTWWDGFAFPTVDGEVMSATWYHGGVAIGGRFSYVGEVEAHNIAWWNGALWEPLGDGIDGDVLTLLDDHDSLIAGGRFTHAGGVVAAGIARWNRVTWSPMGAGLGSAPEAYFGGPSALGLYRDTLVVVGTFTNSGPTDTRNAAWWDGTAWHQLGAGLNRSASALAVFGDRLFVGGEFDSAGAVPADGLAQWNGAQWSAVGGGVHSQGARGSVHALGAGDHSLFVGGAFDAAGAVAAGNIAAWNGAAWSALGAGWYAEVHAIAALGDSVTVGDYGNLATWDGSQWTYAPIPPQGYVAGFATGPAGLLAFGDLTAISPQSGAPQGFKILRRSGNQWLGFENWTGRMHGLGPNLGISALARRQDGSILAGGWFDYAGNPSQWTNVGGLAAWDGAHWTALPPRASRNFVQAILESGGELYVGGPFYDYSSDPGRHVPVDRLDGQQWTHLDTLSVDVRSLAMYQGQLHAAGNRLSLSDPNAGGVYRWNGSHWEPIGPLTDSSDYPGIMATTEFNGRLVVGGAFKSIAGVPATNVAAWDGQRWEALGTALQSDYGFTVYSLAVHDSELYATGDLGAATGSVARWNGVEWESVGHLGGLGLAIASADSQLIVSGLRLESYGPDSEVLSWDGTTWTSLGAGANGFARALLADQGHLYVGGAFTKVGGQPSAGIARWDGPPVAPPATPRGLSPGRPNPFQGATEFAYQLPAAGPVRITVHDLLGRHIVTLVSGNRGAGPHTANWDARDAHGGRVPAGIYLVRMSGPNGQVATTKAVLLP